MIGAGSHMEDELAHRWKSESTAECMAMTKRQKHSSKIAAKRFSRQSLALILVETGSVACVTRAPGVQRSLMAQAGR